MFNNAGPLAVLIFLGLLFLVVRILWRLGSK